MTDAYYLGLVTDLLASLPVVEQIANNSCPTMWLDGSPCEPAYHVGNIAFCIAADITYGVY